MKWPPRQTRVGRILSWGSDRLGPPAPAQPIVERLFGYRAIHAWRQLTFFACLSMQTPVELGRQMTDTSSPGRTLEQRRLLLEQVDARMRAQSDEWDGLDRKATTVLAANGVILGLVINNAGSFAASPPVVSLAFYASLAVLAIALVAGIRSLWPRAFAVVPEPQQFLDQHAKQSPEQTMGELASTKAKAFGDNKAAASTKVGRVRWQMALLALGAGLLVSAYIIERIAT